MKQPTEPTAELKVRCSDQLRQRLRQAAHDSLRSMNCEIIARLRASFAIDVK
jgi:hypothetical protein